MGFRRELSGATGFLLGAAASLIALFACAALASAVGDVETSRSYVGKIGDGGPKGASAHVGSEIQVTVSAHGGMAVQVAAIYSVCTQVDQFDGEQIAFPNATIVHGSFRTP